MVAALIRRQAEGLASFDPFRHLGAVADLVDLAFAGELGPEARQILHRMRGMARWGGFGLWLWGFAPLMAPGFVWLEGGTVVGNISVRHAVSPAGWMIGNVAVHPDYQGRGIGRALMEAATNLAIERGGTWVGLEVRGDNDIARGLYERMGFEEVGATLEMARPPGLDWPRPRPKAGWLRRARVSDSERLYRLALSTVGQRQSEVLGVRRLTYRAGWEARFAAWLEGRREAWWVVEDEGQLAGALRVGGHPRARYHQLVVLTAPDRLSDLGPALAAEGVNTLSRRPSWETVTDLPGRREQIEPAFADLGFEPVRRLVQMRLLLGKRQRL